MFNDAGWFVGQGVVNGLPVVPLPSVANANTSTLDVPSTSQGARAPLARRSTLPPGFERPDVQRQRSTTTTEVWSDSPHDNVVSNLKGQLRLMEAFDKPDTPARSEGLAADVVEGKKPLKVRKPENLYDPFSGQTIGLFSPGPGELDDTQEELWNHLARIHELQSQISVMHSHMEHLGTGERPARMERSVDDEAENPEESARVAKEAEFAKLADRFTGRKEQIDNVMLKLGELSQAINNFHASRAPLFHIRNTMARTADDLPTIASTTAAGGTIQVFDPDTSLTKRTSMETGNVASTFAVDRSISESNLKAT